MCKVIQEENINIEIINKENHLLAIDQGYIEQLTKLLSYSQPHRRLALNEFWKSWFYDKISGDKVTVIARIKGESVGVVRFWKTPYCKDQWMIEGLEVISSRRRIGIGLRMITAGITRLEDMGQDVIYVNISNTNEPSIKLHEKLGFQLVAHGTNNSFGSYRENLDQYKIEIK